jgi:hypothetical protein
MNFGIHVVGPTTFLSFLAFPPPPRRLRPDILPIGLLVARPKLYSSVEEVYWYESLVGDQWAMMVSEVIA